MNNETELKDPQQINFVCKLEEQIKGATVFSIIENSEETTFKILTKFCEYLKKKMENQKILNLLNSSENQFSKFSKKKKNGALLIVKQKLVIRIMIE